MNEPKKDLRVMRTKRSITTTVCRLLSEKDIADITVSEVAKAANVNRKTFYNYYGSVQDVVDEVSRGIVNGLEWLLVSSDPLELMRNPSLFFRELRRAAEPEQEILGYLLRMKGNQPLVNRLIEMLQKQLSSTVHSRLKEEDAERATVILDFIIYGLIYSFREWTVSGQELPLEDYSATVSRLLSDGLNTFLK